MSATRRGFGSIEKRGKSYRARYKLYGQFHNAPHHFATKSAARQWLDSEKFLIDMAAAGRGEWTPPAERARQEQVKDERLQRTVGGWLDEYHDLLELPPHSLRRSTLETYRKTARNRIIDPREPGDGDPNITRLKDIPLPELTKQDVYRWWDAIVKNYDTPETNSKAYQRLKAAIDEAVRREYLDANPVDIREAGKKVKRKDKYLPTDQELNDILAHVDPHYRAFTVLAMFHGLRIGEIMGLELRHVIVKRIEGEEKPRVWVKVEQQLQRIGQKDAPSYMNLQPPKTKAGYRTIPVMPAFVDVILEHLENYAPKKPTVVRVDDDERELLLLTAAKSGKAVKATTYRDVLNAAKRKAGADVRIVPHSGRNWLITRLAEQGAHLKEIGNLLGQDDLSTIMDVYLLVRAERTDSLMMAVNGTVAGSAGQVVDLAAQRAKKEA